MEVASGGSWLETVKDAAEWFCIVILAMTGITLAIIGIRELIKDWKEETNDKSRGT